MSHNLLIFLFGSLPSFLQIISADILVNHPLRLHSPGPVVTGSLTYRHAPDVLQAVFFTFPADGYETACPAVPPFDPGSPWVTMNFTLSSSELLCVSDSLPGGSLRRQLPQRAPGEAKVEMVLAVTSQPKAYKCLRDIRIGDERIVCDASVAGGRVAFLSTPGGRNGDGLQIVDFPQECRPSCGLTTQGPLTTERVLWATQGPSGLNASSGGPISVVPRPTLGPTGPNASGAPLSLVPRAPPPLFPTTEAPPTARTFPVIRGGPFFPTTTSTISSGRLSSSEPQIFTRPVTSNFVTPATEPTTQGPPILDQSTPGVPPSLGAVFSFSPLPVFTTASTTIGPITPRPFSTTVEVDPTTYPTTNSTFGTFSTTEPNVVVDSQAPPLLGVIDSINTSSINVDTSLIEGNLTTTTKLAVRIATILPTTTTIGTTTKRDPCQPNPCQNNATCSTAADGVQAVKCTCPKGYHGALCAVDVCHVPTDAHGQLTDNGQKTVCENGGICAVNATTGRPDCECVPGFMPPYCAERDPCTSGAGNPCKNGGTCTPFKESDSVWKWE